MRTDITNIFYLQYLKSILKELNYIRCRCMYCVGCNSFITYIKLYDEPKKNLHVESKFFIRVRLTFLGKTGLQQNSKQIYKK